MLGSRRQCGGNQSGGYPAHSHYGGQQASQQQASQQQAGAHRPDVHRAPGNQSGAAARLATGSFNWRDAPPSWQRSLRELTVVIAADWQRLGLAR